jgi:hypothetical protein
MGDELTEYKMSELKADIKEIKDSLHNFKQECKDEYVKQLEFRPVRAIAYAIVSVFGIAVLMAIIGLVLSQGRTIP